MLYGVAEQFLQGLPVANQKVLDHWMVYTTFNTIRAKGEPRQSLRRSHL